MLFHIPLPSPHRPHLYYVSKHVDTTWQRMQVFVLVTWQRMQVCHARTNTQTCMWRASNYTCMHA
jgi:hypothetical protein